MAPKRRGTKGAQQKAKTASKPPPKAAAESRTSTRGASKRKASPSPAPKAAPAKKTRAASPSPAPPTRSTRGRSETTKQTAESKGPRSQSKKEVPASSHVTRTAVQQVESKRSARNRSSAKAEPAATPEPKPKQKSEVAKTKRSAAPAQKAQAPKAISTQRSPSSRSRSQTPKAKSKPQQQKASQKKESPRQRSTTPRSKSETPKQKAAATKQKSKPAPQKKKAVTPTKKSPKQKAAPVKQKAASPEKKRSSSNQRKTPVAESPDKSSPSKRTSSRSRAAKAEEKNDEVEQKEVVEEKADEIGAEKEESEIDEVNDEVAEKEESEDASEGNVDEKADDDKPEGAEKIADEGNDEEMESEEVEKATEVESEKKDDEKIEATKVSEEKIAEVPPVVDSAAVEGEEEPELDQPCETDSAVVGDEEEAEEEMEVEDAAEDIDGEKEDDNVEEDQQESVEQQAESESAEIEKEVVEEEAVSELKEIQAEIEDVATDDKAESEQVESDEKECETVECEQLEPDVAGNTDDAKAESSMDNNEVIDVDKENSNTATEEPILVQDDSGSIPEGNPMSTTGGGDSAPAASAKISEDPSVQEISDDDDIEEIGITQAEPIIIPVEEPVANEVNTTGIEIGEDAVQIIEDNEPVSNGATGDGCSPRKRKHDEMEDIEDCSQEGSPVKKARVSMGEEQVENGSLSQEEDVAKDYVVVEMGDVPASSSEEVLSSLPVEPVETATDSSVEVATSNPGTTNPVYSRTFIPNPAFSGDSDPTKTFSLVSYNILADCHLFRNDYSFTDAKYLEPSYRRSKLIEELSFLDADVICLQEVSPSFFNEQLLPVLRSSGYDGTFIKRTTDHYDDGEATFYKTTKFAMVDCNKASLASLVEKELANDGVDPSVQTAVRQYMDRPDVFVVTRLKCIATGQEVTIGNVHIHWGEMKLPDVQAVQITCAVKEVYRIASIVKEVVSKAGADNFPHIICGDFNSSPNSPGYLVARDGYPSGDDTITTLQQVNGLQFPEGQMDSLVNRLWPAFQHTSSSLKSAYSEVTGNEPAISSYNTAMCDTVDYIFYSSSALDSVGVLETAPKDRVMETGGTPNLYFPSDHISLKAVLAFK